MNRFEKFAYKYPSIATVIIFFGFLAGFLMIASLYYIIKALVLAEW